MQAMKAQIEKIKPSDMTPNQKTFVEQFYDWAKEFQAQELRLQKAIDRMARSPRMPPTPQPRAS